MKMLNPTALLAGGIEAEFESAELGDPRRKKRLKLIGASIMVQPEIGFPQMVGDDSELEAFYRFFSNDNINPDEVLRAHVEATVGRIRQAGQPVLVLHDTTILQFGGRQARRGLGPTNGEQQGFFPHVALAVLPGEERLALGVCGMIRVCRSEKRPPKKSWYQRSRDPERESLRWPRLVKEVEKVTKEVDVIHVMDREADSYDLLAEMNDLEARFIVRGRYDRVIEDGRKMSEVQTTSTTAERTIEVAERPEDPNRRPKKDGQLRHPRRPQRVAKLEISGITVSLRRPATAHHKDDSTTVNVVFVREQECPAGTPPLAWTLYTTEPISTPEQLLTIVDGYRSRWVIEELFKALKTGCSIQKRQLESYHALSVALAVFIPVAWRLLLMRSMSRTAPHAPAHTILTDTQLVLIKRKLKLSTVPETVEAATYAVARLGGHLKRNGQPGWLTLGRGFETLLLMEAGWRAALETL